MDRQGSAGVERGQIVFRQFTMDRMEHISILFADIVGFTKMSSNKTAEQLLKLLNELFGEFDHLTAKNNCEKISTLGERSMYDFTRLNRAVNDQYFILIKIM